MDVAFPLGDGASSVDTRALAAAFAASSPLLLVLRTTAAHAPTTQGRRLRWAAHPEGSLAALSEGGSFVEEAGGPSSQPAAAPSSSAPSVSWELRLRVDDTRAYSVDVDKSAKVAPPLLDGALLATSAASPGKKIPGLLADLHACGAWGDDRGARGTSGPRALFATPVLLSPSPLRFVDARTGAATRGLALRVSFALDHARLKTSAASASCAASAVLRAGARCRGPWRAAVAPAPPPPPAGAPRFSHADADDALFSDGDAILPPWAGGGAFHPTAQTSTFPRDG